MITSGQLRAARAILGIDQKALAELCGLSVPTIQRMEASEEVIRGNVDSLMKLIGALEAAGCCFIRSGAGRQRGGRSLCLTERPPDGRAPPPGPRASSPAFPGA